MCQVSKILGAKMKKAHDIIATIFAAMTWHPIYREVGTTMGLTLGGNQEKVSSFHTFLQKIPATVRPRNFKVVTTIMPFN